MRLLLTAGVLAIVALWLLARLRFQDRPITPNPVPAVLGQLSAAADFDDLAFEIAGLQRRLQPSLMSLTTTAAAAEQPPRVFAALRIADQLAVAWLPRAQDADTMDARIRGRDRASGLSLLQLEEPHASVTPPATASAPRAAQPRFLMVSEPTAQNISLRPVFVAALDSRASPYWSEPVWVLPATVDVRPGSFLFTTDAELVGLAIEDEGAPIVVPGPLVLAEAHRLLASPQSQPGTIGVEVQALTGPLAGLTGASQGVVVAWIAPGGSAAELAVGDVIEAIDERPVSSQRHWEVFVSRLKAGDTATLRVRRRDENRTVTVEASPVVAAPREATLGLSLRAVRGAGAEVIQVERGSAGHRTGLMSGDVITLIGETSAPTPRQVARSFAALDAGAGLMIAVTRHQSHLVLVLRR